jgi:hypothetical protein
LKNHAARSGAQKTKRKGVAPPSDNKVRRQVRLAFFGSDMRKIMHIARAGAICLALFLAVCVPAGAGEAPPADWARGRALVSNPEGESVWQQGFFRIIYHTKGEHAVPSTDINANGVPDYVEDAATQLAVSHHIFCNIGGFQNPLESPRYAGANYLRVLVYNRARLKGASGLCFDEPSLAPDYSATPKDGARPALPRVRVITLWISHDIDPKKNLTPSHEYFHHIQNGMTHFKNPWYYEGMARWSEDALGVRPEFPLHDPLRDIPHGLFAASYDAASMFWNPLSRLCANTDIPLPDDDPVLRFTYTNGKPVLRDRKFSGARLLREILERLAVLEKEPFLRYNYGDWSEANQRNQLNNPYIINAAREAATEVCP